MTLHEAILSIRPNAEFVIRGTEIEWHDINQTQPTQAEIDAATLIYEKREVMLSEILSLENSITPRNLREATQGNATALAKISDVDAAIAVLRAKL